MANNIGIISADVLRGIRAIIRRWAASCGRNIAAEVALCFYQRPQPSAGSEEVHMLVSSRTWHAGLLAAVGFEHHCGRRWKFVIHDDGTVPQAAIDRMRSVLPDVRFVPRTEADSRAKEFLLDHPKCLEHRAKHNLFLKFFDFSAFAECERFIVLDSDAIFFRRPNEILEWADSHADTCLYNEDSKEKYCIPRAQILESIGVTMWPRFNSGLVLMPRAAVDLDWAERLLETFEKNAHHPQFFEQTLYGLMASVWNRGGALPSTYEISWGYFRKRGAICRHYVGDFKHDLLYIEAAPLLMVSVLKGLLVSK